MKKFVNLIITFILWVVASIVSNIVGQYVMSLSGGSDWAWIITIPAGFLVVGLITGVSQWIILRNYLTRDGLFLWVPLTAIGLPLGFILGALYSVWTDPTHVKSANHWLAHYGWSSTTTIACIAGAFLGILQWLIIRNKVKGSLWWIPISSLAWGIGTTIAVDYLYTKYVFENGIILGMIVGVITGLVIVFLINTPKTKKKETTENLIESYVQSKRTQYP